jgi:hypothetical protein
VNRLNLPARQNAHHTEAPFPHLRLQESKEFTVGVDVVYPILKQDSMLPVAVHT